MRAEREAESRRAAALELEVATARQESSALASALSRRARTRGLSAHKHTSAPCLHPLYSAHRRPQLRFFLRRAGPRQERRRRRKDRCPSFPWPGWHCHSRGMRPRRAYAPPRRWLAGGSAAASGSFSSVRSAAQTACHVRPFCSMHHTAHARMQRELRRRVPALCPAGGTDGVTATSETLLLGVEEGPSGAADAAARWVRPAITGAHSPPTRESFAWCRVAWPPQSATGAAARREGEVAGGCGDGAEPSWGGLLIHGGFDGTQARRPSPAPSSIPCPGHAKSRSARGTYATDWPLLVLSPAGDG